MKNKLGLRVVALLTTCLVPLAAHADDDDFGISDAPQPKAKPVYQNSVEMGAGYSSEQNMRYDRYRGLNGDHGFAVGNYALLMRSAGAGQDDWFLRGTGQRLGMESRAASVEAGRQGVFKLNMEMAGLPYNYFVGNTPFLGAGTKNLVVAPGWTKAGSASALSANSLATVHPEAISTLRERYRAGFNWSIDKELSLRMMAQHEDKRGVKPLGIDVNSTTSAINIPEPVDHRHDRVETELGYAGKKFQWRLGYQMSVFQNYASSVTVENPFTTNGVANNTAERMQLAPSNVAHSFNADGGFEVNDYTRLTANLSQSFYTQDEGFLPYSANAANTVTTPMPRGSLNGRIANTVANFEVNSRPVTDFDVKARYRYTLRDNQTPRALYNYIQTDNENQNTASTGRFRYNVPYTYEENLAGLDVGYKLASRTKLNVGYEFREFARSFSERARSIDNTGKIQLRSQLSDDLTGTIKYSHLMRDGSNYNPSGSLIFTNSQAYLASNAYDNNRLLRKYFEADLDRDATNVSLTYSATDALVLGLNGGMTVENYKNSPVGLTDSTSYNGTVDGSYALNQDFSLNAFYTMESRHSRTAGVQTFVIGNWWWVDTNDFAHTIGFGTKWKAMEGVTLSADYSFVWSLLEINNDRAKNITTPSSSFPDVVSRNHIVSSRAEYELTDAATVALGYAFERQRTKDWQLDRSYINSTGVLYMGPTSPNYDAHMVTLTTGYRF